MSLVPSFVADGVLLDLNSRLDSQRAAVADRMADWFVNSVRKGQVPDLAARVQAMSNGIRATVMKVEFTLERDVLDVKPKTEEWRMLRHGTLWFDGTNELVNVLLRMIQ